jgi:hypothetical protein
MYEAEKQRMMAAVAYNDVVEPIESSFGTVV